MRLGISALFLMIFAWAPVAQASSGFSKAVDEYGRISRALIGHVNHLRGHAIRCAPATGSGFVQPANDVVANMNRDWKWLQGFRTRTVAALGSPMNPSSADACGGSFSSLVSGIEGKRKQIAGARAEFRTNISGKVNDASNQLRTREQDIRWLFSGSNCTAEARRVDQAMAQFRSLQRATQAIDGALVAQDMEMQRYIGTLKKLREACGK
jgi:hypothetical protein